MNMLRNTHNINSNIMRFVSSDRHVSPFQQCSCHTQLPVGGSPFVYYSTMFAPTSLLLLCCYILTVDVRFQLFADITSHAHAYTVFLLSFHILITIHAWWLRRNPPPVLAKLRFVNFLDAWQRIHRCAPCFSNERITQLFIALDLVDLWIINCIFLSLTYCFF